MTLTTLKCGPLSRVTVYLFLICILIKLLLNKVFLTLFKLNKTNNPPTFVALEALLPHPTLLTLPSMIQQNKLTYSDNHQVSNFESQRRVLSSNISQNDEGRGLGKGTAVCLDTVLKQQGESSTVLPLTGEVRGGHRWIFTLM